MTVTNEYSNEFGISNSSLKDWGRLSPLQWKKKWIDGERESSSEDHFVFGSLLDVLLFTPETFKKKYFIFNGVFPAEAVAKIVKDCYHQIIEINKQIEKSNENVPIEENLKPLSLEDNRELVLTCVKNYPSIDKETNELKFGWQNNWKDDTRIDKIIEQGQLYFNILTQVNEREIITSSLLSLAEELKTILLTNENTMYYFIPTEGVEIFHQFEIYDVYNVQITGNNIPRKGCLDILVVNHNNKTIRVVDFKTDQNAFNFIYTAKKFDYCGQLTYYNSLVENLISDNTHHWHGYTLLPPRNVVIDRFEKNPYVYEYSKYDCISSQYGNREFLPKIPGTNDSIGRVIIGWEEKLYEIADYLQHHKWHYDNRMNTNHYKTLYLYET